MESDTRRTMRDIAEKLGVHYSIVSRHLRAIEKVKKSDKWVSRDGKKCNVPIGSSRFSLHVQNKRNPFFFFAQNYNVR